MLREAIRRREAAAVESDGLEIRLLYPQTQAARRKLCRGCQTSLYKRWLSPPRHALIIFSWRDRMVAAVSAWWDTHARMKTH